MEGKGTEEGERDEADSWQFLSMDREREVQNCGLGRYEIPYHGTGFLRVS